MSRRTTIENTKTRSAETAQIKQNQQNTIFFECNTQELTGLIENIEEIWKLENMKTLKEVAEHCMNILEMNEHTDYKTL